ncbi:hypothetical protein BLNAU_2438 [Blattamonas nauphoetae]|uniref:Uncharacterized protein n=1 Tax=Blattamonas nauphoetae TaxID=2049346 RepID=A0ABQ9YFR8_9EUKA|nr:hypothetical protein BLNAU_2438 [Blattamonas nauphoetae]
MIAETNAGAVGDTPLEEDIALTVRTDLQPNREANPSQQRDLSPNHPNSEHTGPVSRPDGKPSNPLLPTPPLQKQHVPLTSPNLMAETHQHPQKQPLTEITFGHSLTKSITTQPQLTLTHAPIMTPTSHSPSPSPSFTVHRDSIENNHILQPLQNMPLSHTVSSHSLHPGALSFTPSQSLSYQPGQQPNSPSISLTNPISIIPHHSSADIAYVQSNQDTVAEVFQAAWWVYLQIQQTSDLLSHNLVDPQLLHPEGANDELPAIELSEQIPMHFSGERGPFSPFNLSYPYPTPSPSSAFSDGNHRYYNQPFPTHPPPMITTPLNISSPASVTTASSSSLIEQQPLNLSPTLSSTAQHTSNSSTFIIPP